MPVPVDYTEVSYHIDTPIDLENPWPWKVALECNHKYTCKEPDTNKYHGTLDHSSFQVFSSEANEEIETC
jgi:hypothetical protein